MKECGSNADNLNNNDKRLTVDQLSIDTTDGPKMSRVEFDDYNNGAETPILSASKAKLCCEKFFRRCINLEILEKGYHSPSVTIPPNLHQQNFLVL